MTSEAYQGNPRLRSVRIDVGGAARQIMDGTRRVTMVPLTIRRKQIRKLLTPPSGTGASVMSGGGGTVTVDTDPTNDVTGSGASGQVSFWTGAQTQSSSSNLLWTNASNFFRVNGGIGVNRDPFGGRAVDITGGGIRLSGSTSGSFEVNGGNSSFNVTTTGGNESVLLTDGTRARISMTGKSYKYELQVDDVRFRIRDRTAGDLDRLTILANGLVGISAATPAARLHVVGSGTSSSTWTAQFHNSGGANNALMIRDDGRVAMGTNAPNASAILTITSTTGGLLFPRMTTTERNAIATPADGLVIYNTTDNKLQVRAGGAWVDLH